MRKYLYIIALALTLTACGKKVEMDLEMYNSEEVGLMVKGKKVFTWSEGTMQLAFNRTRCQFRAGNDDMTSFFTLTCYDMPREEGQELQADLQWTSGNSVKSTTGMVFKVEKYDGTGLVWLWNAADKTGAIVKILN